MKTLLVIMIVLAFNASGITYIDEPVVWEGGISLVGDHVVIDGGSITVLPDSHINLNGYYIYLDGGRIIAEGTGWAEDEVIEFLDVTESSYEAIKELSVSNAGPTSSFRYCRFYNEPDPVEPDEHPLAYPLYIIDARDGLSYCKFKGSNTAVKQVLPPGGGDSYITDCNFNSCGTGIENTVGYQNWARITNCNFGNCGTGVSRIPPDTQIQGLCYINDCSFGISLPDEYCGVYNRSTNSYKDIANTHITSCTFAGILGNPQWGVGVATGTYGRSPSNRLEIVDCDFWELRTAVEAISGPVPSSKENPTDLYINSSNIYMCGTLQDPSVLIDGANINFIDVTVDGDCYPVVVKDESAPVFTSWITDSAIHRGIVFDIDTPSEPGHQSNVYVRRSLLKNNYGYAVELKCVSDAVNLGHHTFYGGNTITGSGIDVVAYGKTSVGLIAAIGNDWDFEDFDDIEDYCILDWEDDPETYRLDVRVRVGRTLGGPFDEPIATILNPLKERDEVNPVNTTESTTETGLTTPSGCDTTETAIAPASIGEIKALFAE